MILCNRGGYDKDGKKFFFSIRYKHNKDSSLAHKVCETVRERSGLRAIEGSVQCLDKMPSLIERARP